MSEVLELKGINKSFPGVHALKDMSLAVKEGEVHAICGENGAGKSTLMKIVSGVYQQDSGEIILEGKTVSIANPNDAFEKGIAIMYQETSLFNEMTILDNLYLNHEVTKNILGLKIIDFRRMEEKIKTIFKRMNVSLNIHEKVHNIGMAKKQLVEIAKALTFDAKILIMDEPTASLTEREVKALFDIIRKLKQDGVSIIYISHRLEEVFEICDRVTVIRDGMFISCRNASETNKDKLVTDMVGRKISSYFPKTDVPIGDAVLEINQLSQKNVFMNVNLSVRYGEIVGLSGLAGSGRTEIMHAICGFTKIDDGEILINSKKVMIENYRKAMDVGIVYVSEDRLKYGLIPAMNIRGNISLPQMRNISKRGVIDTAKESKLAETAISNFNIKAPGPDFVVENLSGGNQQKVSVAKATALMPKIMILDEPTRGVDVNAKAEIYKIIGDLIQQGVSILMVSSELPELIGICDRIYVMSVGRIVGEFNRDTATQEEILKYALGNNYSMKVG